MTPTTDTTLNDFRDRLKSLEIECKLCNVKQHSLVRHLQQKHSMSPGQYKNQFGDVRLASPLVSEMLRRLDRRTKTDVEVNAIIARTLAVPADWDEHLEQRGAAFQTDQSLRFMIPPVDPFFVFPPETELLALAAEKGLCAYIEGPTGCGKSEWVRQLMARMKRPIWCGNMNGDVTISSFIGMLHANTQGTRFVKGALPLAMEGDGKIGYPALLDEIDFCPPHIGAALHPIMEGRKFLHIAETNETVVARPGFSVYAAANTGGKGDARGHYTGTEVLNTAFLDRFAIKIMADYLHPDVERPMLKRRFSNLQQEVIDKIVKAANDVRSAFKQGTMGVTWSTRKLITYCDLHMRYGQDIALKNVLLNWLDENDQQAVKMILDRIGLKPAP